MTAPHDLALDRLVDWEEPVEILEEPTVSAAADAPLWTFHTGAQPPREAQPVEASALWQFGHTTPVIAAAARRKPRIVSGPSLQELDDAADQMAALVAMHLGRVAGFAARNLGGLTVAASAEPEPAGPLWAFHLGGQHDQASHGRGVSKVKAAADSPLRARKNLGGGAQGKTTWEQHENGTIVRKEFPAGSESKAQVDSEVLASQVAHATGVRSPAVVALDRQTVIMEHVSGETWMERGGLPTLTSDVVDSDEGRLLGLHDVLIGNIDRTSGNFMVDDNGSLVAIDHGYAFQASPYAGLQSPFAGYLSNSTASGFADSIDISPSDIGTIRERLTSLRGDFEAAGRTRWHDEMMDRLSRLEQSATGTRDRL